MPQIWELTSWTDKGIQILYSFRSIALDCKFCKLMTGHKFTQQDFIASPLTSSWLKWLICKFCRSVATCSALCVVFTDYWVGQISVFKKPYNIFKALYLVFRNTHRKKSVYKYFHFLHHLSNLWISHFTFEMYLKSRIIENTLGVEVKVGQIFSKYHEEVNNNLLSLLRVKLSQPEWSRAG